MHFVFSTYGTRGDVFPYILIGRKLAAQEHRVTIATSVGYRADIEAAGLDFAECGPPDPTPEEQKLSMDPLKGFELLMKHMLLPTLVPTIERLRQICADADVLVTHTLSFAGPIVAELEAARGMKWVSTVVSPLALMSGDGVLAAAPWLIEHKTLNALVYKLLWRQFGYFCKPVKGIRRGLGLPPGQNPLWDEAHSPLLQLCLWPRQFAASPTQLNRVYTGFPLADASNDLPDDLAAFFDEGEAPLVFAGASFLETQPFEEQSIAAAKMLGQRALIVGAPASQSGRDILVRPFAPLGAVFGRAAAIVHRGGIGTLALGMRSGQPVVIAPATQDQPDNTRRAVRLGVAVQAESLNAAPLAAALNLALNDAAFRATCQMQGPILTAQNGADVAAQQLIEVGCSG